MLCIAAYLWNKPKQVKDNIKKEKKWGFNAIGNWGCVECKSKKCWF